MTNEASTLLDTDAANKAADADLALQELGSDEIGQAYVTATVTVWDEDAGTTNEKLRLVEKVLEGRDFTCIHETVNAIEAWLGSLLDRRADRRGKKRAVGADRPAVSPLCWRADFCLRFRLLYPGSGARHGRRLA